MSLRSRILVGCTLLVVASCYCIMSLVMNDVRPRYLESVEESMVDTAELAAAMVSALINGDGMPVETVSAAMRELALRRFDARIFNAEKKHVSLQVYITDKQGILVYDSTGKFTPGADFSQWRDVYLTLRRR